ncbi:MAG: hypothetical protein ABJZ55_12515 [Fuerstiella sp.]
MLEEPVALQAKVEEPDEVELQLASTVAVTSQPANPEIPLGLNAVWVPDPVSVSATSSAAAQAVPPAATPPAVMPVAEQPAFVPPVAAAPVQPAPQFADTVAVEAEPNPFAFVDQSVSNDVPVIADTTAAVSAAAISTVAVSTGSGPSESVASKSVSAEGGAAALGESGAGSAAPAVSRGGRRGRRGNPKGALVMTIGSVLFVLSMAGLYWQGTSSSAEPVVKNQPPAANKAWEQEKQQLEADNVASLQLSPTSGEVIPMQYMPFTPHLVCHLRPAELWASDSLHREFIATCGHLGEWLGGSIAQITRFEPQEIEELTFAINFGPRTTPPQVAAVVRLVSEQRPSDLQLNRFKGQVRPDLSTTVYESDEYSYMPINNKTFVVAPVTMSDSLADSKQYGELPMVDLEKLLKHTDRSRQLTLAFDLVNIDTHREYIFGDQMQDFADRFVLWFGKEIKTVSFSLHLRQQEFYVETLLAPSAGTSAVNLRRTMEGRLQQLPEKLMTATRKMKPALVGYREMIGRFPAMMRATALGTTASVDSGLTRLVSYLPSKAAANLAAASLFSWNQSAVTDFSQAPAVASNKQDLPETVVGRLQIPVIVDFRRMPLQEAFAYIADEMKTEIVINGDALKLSGMTQNMPQTLNLGEVPALKAIDSIVSNPDYKGLLVVVVDEGQKKITVTTRPVATEAGLTIYDTKK